MILSRKKQVLLLLTCICLLGFTFLHTGIEMLPWPVETDGQFVEPVSTVALFQSDKKRAEDIKYDEIKAMVVQAVEAAGGLESIVSDGDSVILKPNLVSIWDGQEQVNGITTDYRVTRAVSEIVRGLNPTGWIGVVECAGPNDNRTTHDAFEVYGYYDKENLPDVDDVIAHEDVCGAKNDYNSPELVAVTLPADVKLYPDSKKPNKSEEIYYSKLYYNADVVISIPTLKNHTGAALTVGIKNTSIGMAPTSIYAKPQYNIPNLRYGIDHGYPYLHYWIHDFFLGRPTDFVIVDGLQGLQNGPGSGAKDRKNMRLIMAGKDLVSVDAIAAYIIGMDAELIDYLIHLHNHGAGCVDHKLIRVEGNVRITDVKKRFTHTAQTVKDRMTSDFTPPDVSIISANVNGNTLFLSLDTSGETELVEIIFDGKKLAQNIISDFESIEITGEDIAGAGREIKVIAYDKYRNSSSATTTVTVVKEANLHLAETIELFSNFPNPFNPETVIRYRLPKTAHVNLSVYSMLGKCILVLEDGVKNAGEHSVRWDGTDLSGQQTASGLYIYQLDVISGQDRITRTGKMTLVR